MADPPVRVDLERHAYALEVSGYTTIPAQLSVAVLDDLRRTAELALAAVRAAIACGVRVPFQPGTPHYEAASALYCWGPSALALLAHPTVVGLADLLLREYRLNDLTVFSALSAPGGNEPLATTSWHRDCPGPSDTGRSGHLWFLFCLDDLTADNGATWVVPGSHRIGSAFEPPLEEPWRPLDLDGFPSRRQLTATAGDLHVIDARVIHSSGRNGTSRPRRLLNLGLVHGSAWVRIRTNHWAVAGPAIQATASSTLRTLLGADLPPRDLGCPTSVLPDGWQTD